MIQINILSTDTRRETPTVAASPLWEFKRPTYLRRVRQTPEMFRLLMGTRIAALKALNPDAPR